MRIFLFLLFALALWYGWKQYPKLIERRPAHEAVIDNESGADVSGEKPDPGEKVYRVRGRIRPLAGAARPAAPVRFRSS